MQVTDKVSIEWLDRHNMTRGLEIGVPHEPISLGLSWKDILELTEADFEAIDRYYDGKQGK